MLLNTFAIKVLDPKNQPSSILQNNKENIPTHASLSPL